MAWEPDDKQKEYMKTIQCMTLDSIFGRGVENVETYVENMRVLIGLISQQDNAPDKQPRAVCKYFGKFRGKPFCNYRDDFIPVVCR